MQSIIFALGFLATAAPTDCLPPAPCVCMCQSGAPAGSVAAVPGPLPSSPRTPLVTPSVGAAPAPLAPPVAAVTSEGSGEPSRWYGLPAVVSDVVSIPLIVSGKSPTLVAGAAVFAIGAPINHLANGHSGRALASLGIRTLAGGLAAGAFFLDVLSHPCDGEASCQHTPTAGLAVGVVTLLAAMVVDDVFLARETVHAPPAGVTLAPSVVLAPNLALLSMGGSF